MSDTVDRKAERKEKARDDDVIVDRLESTDKVLVDRTRSTQGDSTGTKLVLHIHPTEETALLKGIPNAPQTCEVGQSIVFGRGEDVDIFLNDHVSRRHMELTSVLDQLTRQVVFKVRVISTMLSININGGVITSECQLKTNDVITIGRLKFTAEIIGNDGDSPHYLLEFKRNFHGAQQCQPPQDPIMFQNGSHAPQYQTQQQPQYQSMQAPQYLAYAPQYQPQVLYQPPHNMPPYYPHIPDPNRVHMPGIQPAVYPGMAAAPTTAPIGMHSPPANSVHHYPMQHPPSNGESRRRSPSENEDSFNTRVSVGETQPPVQDTFPPKN